MNRIINVIITLVFLIGFAKLNVIAYEGITGMGCKLPTIEKNKATKQKENKLKNKNQKQDKGKECQLEFEKKQPQTKNVKETK